MTRRLTPMLAVLVTATSLAGVAHAEDGTTIPPVRADLSVNFPAALRLSTTLEGRVSSRLPASYTATPTVLIGGAPGTSDLRPLLRLHVVEGRTTPEGSPLRIRTTLAERRRVRTAERRLHRRAVLAVRLTGRFDTGATASPHLREFIIHRG